MSETAVNYISVTDIEHLLREDDSVTLIDARTPEEYGEAHVPGAINVPIADLGDYKAAGATVTMCGSTGRGEKAAAILASHGAEDVRVLQGGLKGWRDAGLPVA